MDEVPGLTPRDAKHQEILPKVQVFFYKIPQLLNISNKLKVIVNPFRLPKMCS
jgi:hypothetical protein